jgi:hypothetical protein
LVGVKIFSIERWVRGGSTLEFVDELFESGIDFINSNTKLFLDVFHFGMKGKNVIIHLGLKGIKVITDFMIGFFLEGGSHEGMRGGSSDKKEDK